MAWSPGMKKKRVLLLFPTMWDARQLESCAADWRDRFEVIYGEPSLDDCAEDLDVLGYIDETAARYAGRIDGILSSSDYPGATVASAIGAALGLPSPSPETVLTTSHKYYSRLAQREAAPEATPDFWLIDTRDLGALPEMSYPVFVKPVKGSFSVHSRKVRSADELRAFLDEPGIREYTDEYLAIFNAMVTRRLGLEIDGHFFVAESFMHGVQATVEGFVVDGDVTVYGIVDSVFHKDTGSFARFDYPSGLRDEVQADMASLAQRVIPRTGLNHSLFNIEMIYDAATDEIRIIEINPRICGQFGDLYAKVDGRNSYVAALEVATGGRPPPAEAARSMRCGHQLSAPGLPASTGEERTHRRPGARTAGPLRRRLDFYGHPCRPPCQCQKWLRQICHRFSHLHRKRMVQQPQRSQRRSLWHGRPQPGRNQSQ